MSAVATRPTIPNDEAVAFPQLNGGVRILFTFENGYQASMIKGPYSYGGALGL